MCVIVCKLVSHWKRWILKLNWNELIKSRTKKAKQQSVVRTPNAHMQNQALISVIVIIVNATMLHARTIISNATCSFVNRHTYRIEMDRSTRRYIEHLNSYSSLAGNLMLVSFDFEIWHRRFSAHLLFIRLFCQSIFIRTVSVCISWVVATVFKSI